jgi:hypothetical protein
MLEEVVYGCRNVSAADGESFDVGLLQDSKREAEGQAGRQEQASTAKLKGKRWSDGREKAYPIVKSRTRREEKGNRNGQRNEVGQPKPVTRDLMS